jgi:hypothetical protein
MLSGEAERLHLEIGMKGKCSDEIGRKNKKIKIYKLTNFIK